MTWLLALVLVLFALCNQASAQVVIYNRYTGAEINVTDPLTDQDCVYVSGTDTVVAGGTCPSTARSFWVSAGGLSTDGTHCGAPARAQINSGPRLWVLTCADNDGSEAHFNVGMPDGWDGGTITIELQALSVNASPADALDVDFSCQCRGDGDLLDDTWGTAKNVVVTFDGAQYDEEHATTAALTPNGTCAGGDSLYCRMVVDATNTTAAMADVRILGMKVEYTRGDED